MPKNGAFASYRQSHQQLSSSHATDRLAAVAVGVARIDVARVEAQEVSVARTIRSRRPIEAVGPRIAQRAIDEAAAAQKVVGGVQILTFIWESRATGTRHYSQPATQRTE